MIRDINRYFASAQTHNIYTQGATPGHPQSDQAVRMRNIEYKIYIFCLWIGDLRTPIGIRSKSPLLRMNGKIARQHSPHQCPGYQIPAAVPLKIKTWFLSFLGWTE